MIFPLHLKQLQKQLIISSLLIINVIFILFLNSCEDESSKKSNACTSDQQCPAHTKCIHNNCTALKAGDTCDEKIACPENMICKEGKCSQYCEIDDDCENGYICKLGDCLLKDCSNNLCNNSISQISCNDNNDCPENFHCDMNLHQCKEDENISHRCIDDSDCDPDMVCHVDSGQCVEEDVDCQSDADCENDRECNIETGNCEEDRCTSDSDCFNGEKCDVESGECLAIEGCEDNTDCLNGEYCDRETGQCVDISNRCDSDSDCNNGYKCELTTGECVPDNSDCSSNSDCPSGMQCDIESGNCIQDTSSCQTDADCPAGFICELSSHSCIRSSVECTQDSHCPQDYFCNPDGRCIEDQWLNGEGNPTCESDNDCTQGICLHRSWGSICAKTCCSAWQCDDNYACVDGGGIRFCVHERWLNGQSVGSDEYGQECSAGSSQCHSGLCDTSNNRCSDFCCTDDDCNGLGFCLGIVNANLEAKYYACKSDFYGLGKTGDSCMSAGECFYGICIVPGECSDPCCTSRDCPAAYACGQIPAPNETFIYGCMRAEKGTISHGGSCTKGEDCLTGVCDEILGKCSDTCCMDEDCSNNEKCRPRDNGMSGFMGICAQ